MHLSTEWWPRCEFVRDYFFGGHKKTAHQLAEYLARYYVGEAISELRPDTDVSALVGDSIRQSSRRRRSHGVNYLPGDRKPRSFAARDVCLIALSPNQISDFNHDLAVCAIAVHQFVGVA